MMEEDQGVFPFEFSYWEDDLLYGHFVYVDMTQAPELAEFVRTCGSLCGLMPSFICRAADAEAG